MSERQQKALEIAAKTKRKKNGKHWVVPSQTGDGTEYKVDNTNPDWPTCTCIDFELRQIHCKHIYAVEYTIEREQKTTTTKTKTSDGEVTTTTVTETVKLRYKQVWKAYTSAQTQEKAKFLELLYALCSNVDEPIQHMGRTRLPMSDMLFATVYKIYAAVSSRRFMTDLKDACARRYISKFPSFNSINNY